MFHYYCLNPISKVGLEGFTEEYQNTQKIEEADGILVRSASMHDMELPENLLAVARAGAGVNNIPLEKCAQKGIVVFNTPGANANGVKEIVIAGMLLAARDIVEGINWVRENSSDANVAKAAEKIKKNFAGTEIQGKKLGIIGLGAIGVKVANTAKHLGMEVYGYDPYVSVDAAWNLSRDVKHVIDVNEIYEECFLDESREECLIQEDHMTEEDREYFLRRFEGNRDCELTEQIHMEVELEEDKSLLGFCVMGGIFSEGIDLKRDSLIGAVIVGTGIPQVCSEREILKR